MEEERQKYRMGKGEGEPFGLRKQEKYISSVCQLEESRSSATQ